MKRLSVLRNTLDGPVRVAEVAVDPTTGYACVELLDTPHRKEVARSLGEVVGSDRLRRPVAKSEGELYLQAVADNMRRATYWQARLLDSEDPRDC